MAICGPMPHLITEIPADVREQLADFLSAEIMRSRLNGPIERAPTPLEDGLNVLRRSLGSTLADIEVAALQ